MGRRVLLIVAPLAAAAATVAIVASAPIFLGIALNVLAGDQPHSCGEPSP
jgi:hypothetical protein